MEASVSSAPLNILATSETHSFPVYHLLYWFCGSSGAVNLPYKTSKWQFSFACNLMADVLLAISASFLKVHLKDFPSCLQCFLKTPLSISSKNIEGIPFPVAINALKA
jgi:hypothetical protein